MYVCLKRIYRIQFRIKPLNPHLIDQTNMSEDYGLEPFRFPFPATPEHPSGMATPPLHASASVPFKWEEQPGKPRPCTDLIPATKCLELPPCRMTKMPSPTTVLDGPDNLGRPKFSSFRLFREKQSSFDSSSGSASPQSAVDVFLGKNKKSGGRRLKIFGRRRSRSRRGTGADDGGFSPSSFAGFDSVPVALAVEGKMMARPRSGRFSSFSQAAPTPPLWANMYQSLKQAIPWKRTRKPKKQTAP